MGTRTSEGIAQLSSGHMAEGRATLLQALAAGEPAAPVWYALSLAADSSDECRRCLQNAVAADPSHDLARWELARLNAPASLRQRALNVLRRAARAARWAAQVLTRSRAA